MINAQFDKGFVQPAERYYFQVLYKQNADDGEENVPGNLYSEVDSVALTSGVNLTLNLKSVISPYDVVQHKFVKPIVIQSKCLSDFSGHPR